MAFQLEICCFNMESARIAQGAGADRIELCASPGEGGTTPSFGLLRYAREKISVPIFPIIRPRGGDFLYSEEEFDVMMKDVLQCRQLHADGIVTGLLGSDGTVDKTRLSRLVERAFPLEVTFHRAFDWTADPFEALETILDAGCSRILTSGQKELAMEGKELIGELVRQAAERIIIMPGSGVRAKNIAQLAGATGAKEFHSSARRMQSSEMAFINPSMGEPLDWVLPDAGEIELMAGSLRSPYSSPA
jgi:copper homeostasis protein